MKNDSGATTSIWMTSSPAIAAETKLPANATADVCVVGAGIAGLTIAYLLAREGKQVIVLDDGPIGGAMTARTTAHLAIALDDRYYELERLHGEKGARLAADSHTAAIDRIETIVKAEAIDCDFERLDGYLLVQLGESQEILTQELAALQRAGLTGMELLQQTPLDSNVSGACLRFPQQGQFHPLKYLAGLAKAITRDHGRIYTGIHASTITGGERARVETSDGAVVTAGAVVVATNSPVNDLFAIHTKQAAYLTYVIGVRVPRGSVMKALYWDTLDPYHYVRIVSDKSDSGGKHDFLIVGGEDHKSGQEDDAGERFTRLESWTRSHFPTVESVDYRWTGEVLEPIDGLAFIGRNPLDDDNVFIATGASGNGMTYGTIAGILLTDLIVGRENPWADLYDPARKTLRALPEFVKENINVAEQLADWLTPGEVKDESEIAPGTGAILRRGLSKVAAYRDKKNKLHECSAVCPHLGCLVNWNSLEKTWDCPCHGSRFNSHGCVINGPANRDLPISE